MKVPYNVGVLAASLLNDLVTNGNVINVKSVEVQVLDVSLDIGDIDVGAGPGLVEVDGRETSEGEVAAVPRCVTRDGHTKVWVHQAFLVHGGEDRVVMNLILGSLVDAVRTVYQVRHGLNDGLDGILT